MWYLKNLVWNKCIILCLSILVVLKFFLPPPILKASLNVETFDNGIRSLYLWKNIRGDGIQYANESGRDIAIFSSESYTTFPYLRTYDFGPPIISRLSIWASFSSNTTNQGAGIIVGDVIPEPGEYVNFDNLLFFVWPKGDGTFHLFTKLCSVYDPDCDERLQLINGVFEIQSNAWHNIIFKYDGGRYYVYLDEILKFETVATDRIISGISLGQPELVETPAIWPGFKVDTIVVESQEFSYLSQLDPLWAGEEYDHASEWAGTETGIDRWGCALTSAAMILKNYDIKNATDGASVDPSLLNSWLKQQDDGYVREGLINWLSITRFAKASKLAGQSMKNLEFVRARYDPATVSNNLSLGYANILGELGHFIVAHTDNGEAYDVADPRDVSRTTAEKTENFLTANVFIPSDSDLSNWLIALEPGTSASLFDSNNNPQTLDWQSEYITDTISGTSSAPIQTAYLPKLSPGKYRIVVKADYEGSVMDLYLYGIVGDYTKERIVLPMGESSYEINYDPSDMTNTSVRLMDTEPPIVEITSPTVSLLKGEVTIAGSLTDANPHHYWLVIADHTGKVVAGPGVVYSTASFVNQPLFSFKTNNFPDGKYTIKFEARDAYENKSDLSVEWMDITVDNTAPAQVRGVRILDHTGKDLGCGGAVNNRSIKVDWEDSLEPDFDYYWYDIKDITNFKKLTKSENSGDIRDLDGMYMYRVKAVDKTGNVGVASPWCEVTLDRVIPGAPGNPFTLPNPTNLLTQHWNYTESSDQVGIGGYYERIYDVLESNYLTDWFWLGKTLSAVTNLQEGEWQLDVMSEDTAGNRSEVSRSSTLVVDVTPPTLTNKTEFSGWYTAPVTSKFYFADPNLSLDYEVPSCETVGEGKARTCTTLALVCDTAGNCYSDPLVSSPSDIDLSNPVVALDVWGSTLRGTASDNLSGVEKVIIKLSKPGESEVTVTALGAENWEYTIEDYVVGSYTAKIIAYDWAGNASQEITKVYDINATDSSASSPVDAPPTTPLPEESVLGTSDVVEIREELDVPEAVIPGEILGSTSEQSDEAMPTDQDQSGLYKIVIMVALGSAIFLLIFFLMKKR